MKKILLIIAITSNVVWTHCDSCLKGCDSGPFIGNLFIKLTENEENPRIPIEIYEGNYDDGILIIQDTITDDDIERGKVFYELDAGFYYSATATYQQGAKKIIAIDGSEMNLESDDCDCDYPTDLTLNLRLAK